MTADDLQKAWGLWQAGEATAKAGEKAEETVEEDAMVQKVITEMDDDVKEASRSRCSPAQAIRSLQGR